MITTAKTPFKNALEDMLTENSEFLERSGQLFTNLLMVHCGMKSAIVEPGVKIDHKTGEGYPIYEIAPFGPEDPDTFEDLLVSLKNLEEKVGQIQLVYNPDEGTIRFPNENAVITFFRVLSENGYNITDQPTDNYLEIPDASAELDNLRMALYATGNRTNESSRGIHLCSKTSLKPKMVLLRP